MFHTRTLADARLLHLMAAAVVYTVYVPLFVMSVVRIFARESNMVVFSGNLKLLPIRSWLRTALVAVAFSMFMFETSDIVMDGLRYWQVKDLPEATTDESNFGVCHDLAKRRTFRCTHDNSWASSSIPTLATLQLYFLSVLFLGIVLLKQTKWDAIVPAIAPLTVHGWAAFIHVSTPTAQRTFNTNTGVAEAFLNFILVGSLGGTVAYRSWQGQMYMVKLADNNLEETRGFNSLMKLMWRDSTARRHMLSSVLLIILLGLCFNFTSVAAGPVSAVARLTIAIVCTHVLRFGASRADVESNVEYTPLAPNEEGAKDERAPGELHNPTDTLTEDITTKA